MVKDKKKPSGLKKLLRCFVPPFSLKRQHHHHHRHYYLTPNNHDQKQASSNSLSQDVISSKQESITPAVDSEAPEDGTTARPNGVERCDSNHLTLSRSLLRARSDEFIENMKLEWQKEFASKQESITPEVEHEAPQDETTALANGVERCDSNHITSSLLRARSDEFIENMKLEWQKSYYEEFTSKQESITPEVEDEAPQDETTASLSEGVIASKQESITPEVECEAPKDENARFLEFIKQTKKFMKLEWQKSEEFEFRDNLPPTPRVVLCV
ncbi:hypothetical protein CCACVL1_17219 [Corchorus capsularis]|uniref:Uncharacterized protein n=1 Tax=Corchorus capsularis TaxID=210143 RepID=A0A1R3HTC6_COCAP|nr:hypothetical protein CCACVL1_17219 [Corchorus capsularis]